ncbi:hypothetical protein BJ508DRAFT_418607 [Ascobolus immersus RN42]|uniref:Uncharacterized protein n=1 Tax=Ascobolus immersus RN42 TaxID=1160509 RepID=A0A3N4HQW7_ASCIM|nr:hypothetical protein BJ508DRAFT_418607 [Ascobolus immersus RN42]
MGTPTDKVTLATLPTDILFEIFSRSGGSQNARALGNTSSRLHSFYITNHVHIHTAIAKREFSANLLSVLRAGDPTLMHPRTAAFLANCACAVGGGKTFEILKKRFNGDTFKVAERFPYYWLPGVGNWRPIGKDVYEKLIYDAFYALWGPFMQLFPFSDRIWAKASSQYAKNSNKTSTELAPEVPCDACNLANKPAGHRCLWHESQCLDELLLSQFAIRCIADTLTKRQFTTPELWDAFLTWTKLYTTSLYPLPPVPGTENCRKDCKTCESLFVPSGGHHIWDHTPLEKLTKRQIDALRHVEDALKENENCCPFLYPYQPAKVGPTQNTLGKTFTPYWDGLSEFTKLDAKTGRLVSIRAARRKLFDSDRFKAYSAREIEVPLQTGGTQTKFIVVDENEWDHVQWQRNEIERRHRGEAPRDRMQEMLSTDDGKQEAKSMIYELIRAVSTGGRLPTGTSMAGLSQAQKMSVINGAMTHLGLAPSDFPELGF